MFKHYLWAILNEFLLVWLHHGLLLFFCLSTANLTSSLFISISNCWGCMSGKGAVYSCLKIFSNYFVISTSSSSILCMMSPLVLCMIMLLSSCLLSTLTAWNMHLESSLNFSISCILFSSAFSLSFFISFFLCFLTLFLLVCTSF